MNIESKRENFLYNTRYRMDLYNYYYNNMQDDVIEKGCE
jgi:hypothetical protein